MERSLSLGPALRAATAFPMVFESVGMAFQALGKLREQVASDARALELAESYASLYGYL